MSNERSLREELFYAEPLSVERQQRFRNELDTILEPRLTLGQRRYYQFALVGQAIGLVAATYAVWVDADHRWLWSVVLLLGGYSTAWLVHILRRNAEPLGMMQAAAKFWLGLSTVGAGLMIAWGLQNPSLTGILWALAGLLLVALTSFINLWNRLLTTERTMREHLLRVEYRLAEQARPE